MTVDDLIQQAEALIEIERFDEAGAMLTRALSIEPENGVVHCRLAQVHRHSGRWGDARRSAERAIALDPENSDGYRLLSIILTDRAFHPEAVQAAEDAVELSPIEPANWHTLARACLKAGRLKEARAAGESLRELVPDWYLSHQCLSLIALHEKNFKEAEEHCRRELELNPNSYEGLNNLGVALLDQRRRREAVAAFHSAAKLKPNEPLARENLVHSAGRVLPQLGLSGVAIWLLFKFFQLVFTTLSLIEGVLFAGAVLVVIAGAICLFSYYRDRGMSSEVRAYLRLYERSQGRDRYRDLLMGIWIGALLLGGFWLAYLYAFRRTFQYSTGMIELWGPTLVLLVIGACAFRAHWRLERS